MIDSSMREEETRKEVENTEWSRVMYRHLKTTPTVWKKKEPTYSRVGRDPKVWNENNGKLDQTPVWEEKTESVIV